MGQPGWIWTSMDRTRRLRATVLHLPSREPRGPTVGISCRSRGMSGGQASWDGTADGSITRPRGDIIDPALPWVESPAAVINSRSIHQPSDETSTSPQRVARVQRRRARQDAANTAADIKCIVLRRVVVGRSGLGGFPGDGGKAGREGCRSRREEAVWPNYRRADSSVTSHLRTCFSGWAEEIRVVRSGYMAQTREKRNCYGEATWGDSKGVCGYVRDCMATLFLERFYTRDCNTMSEGNLDLILEGFLWPASGGMC